MDALIEIPFFSYNSPDTYVDINTMKGALIVIQAARELGLRRVIHTSTNEVYAASRYVSITENHPLQGQSPYSASKIPTDHLAYSFFTSFNLTVLTVSPFNTYSRRNSSRDFMPTIITQLTNGNRQVKLGSIFPTRDFNFVQYTVLVFIAALESVAGDGEVSKIGSNSEISIGETALATAEAMGVTVEIVTDPKRLMPESNEFERFWPSNSKAQKLIGWEPRFGGRYGLIRSLSKTIEWFLEPSNLSIYKLKIYNVC